MPFLHFNNVGISGLACAVPSHVQKIILDPERPGYTHTKSFVRQTGFTQRHISLTEQTSLDLSYAAAVKALEKAKWRPDSVDAIISMTQTPDYFVGPGNGCLLQHLLNLRQSVMACDITVGCSSFPYGLSVCASLLQNENINRIIMVSGDTQWFFYNSQDEILADNAFIHGEGCTAVLLEKTTNSPINISLYTDGSGFKHLFFPVGGTRNTWKYARGIVLPNGQTMMPPQRASYMDGIEITSFSTTTAVDAIKDFLAHFQMGADSLDGLILHQANLQIVKTIAKRLKIDMARVPLSLDRYANTSGASISLTIADAYAESPKKSLNLLCAAFGIGLSWGVASVQISPEVIEPIFTCDDVFEEKVIGHYQY